MTKLPRTGRKVVVSAGDPSGDLILAEIVKHIRARSSEPIEFVGLGGPALEAAGVRLVATSAEVAVVGLVEVLANLRHLFSVLGRLGAELKTADSLLCADFPDFNLRLAEIAAKLGKPVDYAVAPQVWVWRSNRLHQMRRLVRKMYPALPFEEEIFRAAGIDARYLGHPIRDLLPPRNRVAARAALGLSPNDLAIVLMPGSRKNELRVQFPLMVRAWAEAAKLQRRLPTKYAFASWRAVLAVAPGWDEAGLVEFLSGNDRKVYEALKQSGQLRIARDSREALAAADFGWITSGTATLEAALYQVPHILVYRLSRVSAFLLRQMTSYFSRPNAVAGLPNILLGKKVVPELLQDDLTPRRLAIETVELLGDGTRMMQMKRDLRWLPKKLGETGATERIAADLSATWGLTQKENA